MSAPPRAALATRHGTESIFRPALARIGIEVVVASIDTDRFGTFSGEIERVGSPIEVVERKARAAAEATGLTAGLASEGSFGTHPTVPYAIVDTELVAWVDTSVDHVVIERATAISSVPARATIEDPDRCADLRITGSFPDQAAIVVIDRDGARTVVAKDIRNTDALRAAVERGLASGPVLVEPDLRAHCCPERRTVIAAAVERLADRLARPCPECDAPGFGAERTVPGLPCALCGLPTTRPRADVLECGRCGHLRTEERPGAADPGHCDRCNP